MAQLQEIKAANIEKVFNDLISKYIYAAFEDIKSDWNGPEKMNELTYQNYKNLMTRKDMRPKDAKGGERKLTSVFSISTEVKQIYTKMFIMLIQEIKNINLTDNDTLDSMLEKLIAENVDCCSEFIFKLSIEYKSRFGKCLRDDAADVNQYFHQRIQGQLPQFRTKTVILALVAKTFDDFLKATAWILAKQIWYYPINISQAYFMGMLASLNIKQIILDELQNSLRKRENRPRKISKTPPPNVTMPTNEVVVTPNEVAAVLNDASLHLNSIAAPVKVKSDEDDDLQLLLE